MTQTDIVALAEECGAELGRHEGQVVWMKLHPQAIQAFAAALTAPAVDLQRVYSAFGIGELASSIDVLMANIENVKRRSDCLWRIEHEFFMVPTPPDDDDEEPGQECLLCWGHEPDQYAAQFRVALSQIAAKPVEAPAVALPAESDGEAKKWLLRSAKAEATLRRVHRLMPIFERGLEQLTFTAETGGEIDADMKILQAELSGHAAPAAQADPMDWPLPCDVTVGHGTMSKGLPLRSLVARMKVLYEMATGNNADEVAARTIEQRRELFEKSPLNLSAQAERPEPANHIADANKMVAQTPMPAAAQGAQKGCE